MSSSSQEDVDLPYLPMRVALRSGKHETMAIYLELSTGFDVRDEY